MSDYAKLIADLRDVDQTNWKRRSLEAAEAIEELQAEVKQAAKRNAELHAELEKWISAAEKAGEPKRGEWVGVEYDGYADGNPVYDLWECSVCGEEHNGEADTLPNFCPNCGAKMEVQDDA